MHEVGDARCRKQQAEDGVDEKTVAEPATFLTAPFDRSGQEDWQGQPAGQDVRRQFRVGNTVEDVNQAGPEGEQQQVLLCRREPGLRKIPSLLKNVAAKPVQA